MFAKHYVEVSAYSGAAGMRLTANCTCGEQWNYRDALNGKDRLVTDVARHITAVKKEAVEDLRQRVDVAIEQVQSTVQSKE